MSQHAHCTNPKCGKEIAIQIFKDSGFCSVACRKAAGDDQSSVGTYMFVTKEEEKMIGKVRGARRRV